MYESYWKLTEKPYENTPDPRYLFLSPQHEEALTRLLYTVKEGKGACVLTGIFGCGKTLLAKVLTQRLESDLYRVAYLSNLRLDDIDLLRMVTYYLGNADPPSRKSDLLIGLERILDQNWKDGRRTVLILDEAHVVQDPQVFEEIRLLLNYQLERDFLLTVVLMGQPELRAKVDQNKQLAQRIAIHSQLEALSKEETVQYIRHRWQIGSALGEGTESPFAPEASDLIAKRGGGIPRRINQICDMSLLVGYSKKAPRIDPALVQEAIESLEK